MSSIFGKTKEELKEEIKKNKYIEMINKKKEELINFQPNETEEQKKYRNQKNHRFINLIKNEGNYLRINKNYDSAIKRFEQWNNEEIKRDEEEIKIHNLEKKIKEILKNLDFYNRLNNSKDSREVLFLGVIDLEKLNYEDFLAYKLYITLNYINLNKNNSYTEEYIKRLSILNPIIFIKNVNIEWRIMQLAKSDISTQSPKKSSIPLPPPPPSPHLLTPSITKKSKLSSIYKIKSPKFITKITAETLQEAKSKLKPKPPPQPKQILYSKNNVSMIRVSPLTGKKLEEAKSRLKHSKIKINPDNPDYDLEMAFRKLERSKSSKK